MNVIIVRMINVVLTKKEKIEFNKGQLQILELYKKIFVDASLDGYTFVTFKELVPGLDSDIKLVRGYIKKHEAIEE